MSEQVEVGRQIAQIVTRDNKLYRVQQPIPVATGVDPQEPAYISAITNFVREQGDEVYWVISKGLPGTDYARNGVNIVTEIQRDQVVREDSFVSEAEIMREIMKLSSGAAEEEASEPTATVPMAQVEPAP